ncbi:MAG: hypothetical protein JNJ73_19170 [Hyphomonadaceae bacterium]|nr:hypothetical protein [Hyphomonadaceae bacterium]
MNRAESLMQEVSAFMAADITACEAALAVAERVQALRVSRALPLVGLNGAQGSGKSTLAALLKRALAKFWNARTAVLSLDDFYLTKADRLLLAAEVHPLCATRGVPGTHDCPLLAQTLSQLTAATAQSRTQIPAFSKLDDDRAPADAWTVFVGCPDIILFEGWCVGLSADLVPPWRGPINALESEADPDGVWHRWSRGCLAERYTPFWQMIDLLVCVAQPEDIRSVVQSRLKQEQGLSGEAPRMDERQIERFVQHYERYTLALWSAMPHIADMVVRRDRDFRFSIEKR